MRSRLAWLELSPAKFSGRPEVSIPKAGFPMDQELPPRPFREILQNFVPHLEELRRRLILCGVFLIVASAFSWFFARQILDFLTAPLQQLHIANLYFQKPFEAFVIHLKAAVFAGLLLSLPVFFTQGWLFVAPGIYERE